MSASHTPGKWIVVKRSILCNVVRDEGLLRSFVTGDIPPRDAALIAAAPDLLEALEACIDAAEYVDSGDVACALDAKLEWIRRIVAKAKGQP